MINLTTGKTEPRDYTPEYQLLDRLRMDCEYFLGAGQHSEKHEADADAQPFAHEMMRLGREVGIGSVHGLLVCFFASHVGPA